MVLNLSKKYIFFCNAKTGSTTIRAAIGGDVSLPSNIYHITPDTTVRLGLIEHETMENLYKVAFVRNPYERFLSTYLFGIQNTDSLRDWSGELKLYGSFEEFVIKFNNSTIRDDIHFKKQIEYTQYNGNKINFIGRYESYHDDMKTFFTNIKRTDLASKVKSFAVTKQSKKNKPIDDYFNNKIRDIIKQIYYEDFENFYPHLL